MNLFLEKLNSSSNFLLFDKNHELIIHLVEHLKNRGMFDKNEIRYIGNSHTSYEIGINQDDNLITEISKKEINEFSNKVITEMMGSDKSITIILAFPVTMSMILGTSLKQLILMNTGERHRIIISSNNVFVMPYYARKLFNFIMIGSQMELMESKTIYEAYLNMFNSYDDVYSILSSINNDRFLMYNYNSGSIFGNWKIYPSSILNNSITQSHKIEYQCTDDDGNNDNDDENDVEILSDFEINI